MGKTLTEMAMLREIWHRVRASSTREDLIFGVAFYAPMFVLAWVYFHLAHFLPMVLDMLFPLFLFASARMVGDFLVPRLGIETRSFWPEAGETTDWRYSTFNKRGFQLTFVLFTLGGWIRVDHTNRFPVEVGVVLLASGIMLFFIVPVLNAAYYLVKARIVS